jgi:hypothetical protein
MLPLLLFAMLQQAHAADAIFMAHRAATRAEIPCRATDAQDEITVCALRDADRYRVPFVEITPGDPHHEGVFDERVRSFAVTNNCTEMRLMQVGCGMVGISLSTSGSGVRVATKREPAP